MAGRKRIVFDIKKAIEMYEAGYKLSDISSVVGVKLGTVRNRLKEMGVVLRTQGAQKRLGKQKSLEGLDIENQYVSGVSMRRLVELTGVSYESIAFYLKNRGIAIRGRSEAMVLWWGKQQPSMLYLTKRDCYGFPVRTEKRHYDRWNRLIKVDVVEHEPLYTEPTDSVS